MINDFTEKNIRRAILKKVKPKITHKKSKHWKASILLDDKIISKIKIPNEHNRIMKESKSKFIAGGLRLQHNEFNELVDCTLTGSDYYDIQKKLGD